MTNSPPRRVDGSSQVRDLVKAANRALREGSQGEALVLLGLARQLDAPAVERYAVGEALLRASNGRLGWDLYDLHPSRPIDRLPGVRRWDGQPCRLLVLVAEQGFGDAIQFLRFVPQVVGRGLRVVVAIHDELLDLVSSSPLLRGCTTMSKSAARRTRWPAGTRWERLMSVPARLCEPELSAVAPYLQAAPPAERVLARASAGCLTVGVAWRSTTRPGIADRSIPDRHVGDLARTGRVRVVSLHRTKDVETVPDGVAVVSIDNFVDTATVISQCDYVVTADTVTAHLAPALGVPTLICLRHWPDWRWGTPHHPTRWYAHAQLLIQDDGETWEPVLDAATRHILDGASLGTPPSRVVGGPK